MMVIMGPEFIVPEDTEEQSVEIIAYNNKTKTQVSIVAEIYDRPLSSYEYMDEWVICQDTDRFGREIFTMYKCNRIVNRYGYIYLPMNILDLGEYIISTGE